MAPYDQILGMLPGVGEPKAHLNFKARLIWTSVILLLFFVLGQITLYGASSASIGQFQYLEIVLGSSIGSLITLGIGPIVTSSIILQLLVGSQILGWDLKTHEGRAKFQGTQKLLALFFCFFEAFAFVAFGAVAPNPDISLAVPLLILQLAFGAFLLLLMDEVVSKWGVGSGVSLFIAGGVAKGIFVRSFNPLTLPGETVPIGLIPQFAALLGLGEIGSAFYSLLPVFATILVFFVVIYVQAMKVEIPLAFAAARGFSRRWPLKLIYTSNIPVILIAALLANIQLVGSIMATADEFGNKCGPLGCFDQTGRVISGVAFYLQPPASISVQIMFLTLLFVVFLAMYSNYFFKYKNPFMMGIAAIAGGLLLGILMAFTTVGLPTASDSLRVLTYFATITAGSVIFSIFWVSTSGMDSKTVAGQIEGLGMQIPGFRRDPRIVESVLNRYIPTLAIISGFLIGMLAAVADFTGAIGTGTGILLSVMIVYQLYEQIAQKYAEDMHPALRRFFE